MSWLLWALPIIWTILRKFWPVILIAVSGLIIWGYISSWFRDDTKIAYRTIASIQDGDTIAYRAIRLRKVDLKGVDCPELTQSYGPEAKAYTTKCVLGKRVRLTWEPEETVVLVGFGAEYHWDLSGALVQYGLAWSIGTVKVYDRMQRKAQKAKLGLWADPDPEPPWTYRKERRK